MARPSRTVLPFSSGPEPDYDALASGILEVAEEVVAAERKIKEAVLEAARAGDCSRVVELVSQWLEEPAVEVAAGLKG